MLKQTAQRKISAVPINKVLRIFILSADEMAEGR